MGEKIKNLNNFGGWLAFFYFSIWISFITMIGYELYFLILNISILFKAIFSIGYGTLILIIYKIIKSARKKNDIIPDCIVQLLSLGLLFSVIFSLIEILLSVLLIGFGQSLEMMTEIGTSTFRSVVAYLIWMSYFQKSKRVYSYYGKNAGKPSIKMNTIRGLFRK